MKILVVDDSATMRKIVMNSAKSLGEVEFVEAEDGIDGFEKLQANQDVELILSDWNMPNCNGLDFLKKVIESGHKAPVIMVTTEAERENVLLAIKTGAKNYLTKPFTADQLIDRISKTMGL